jgi:hypothetical protein
MAEWRRHQRGAIAVEAAFVLPVVIVAAMMFIELANIGLTINLGASALERAVQQFRRDGVEDLIANGDLAGRVRERMVAASHGYLEADEVIEVEVESFASLDAMGGGSDNNSDEDDESAVGINSGIPAWRINVGIRKNYITPLVSLLGVENNTFGYRYQQVLSYLPGDVAADGDTEARQ